jgi:multidrug efflux pump subunit AcrB
VLGSTGVLLFAFLPIANIPEGSGDFVRGLPMAVLFTVGASLIVSLTVVPFLASKVLSEKEGAHGNRYLQILNNGIERFYQPMLHRALDNPWKTFVGATIGCAAVLAAIPLLGLSLFPGSDSPYFVIRIEAPEGSSIATTDKAVRYVSSELAKEPLVVSRMENVGRGNPQIFYNNLQRENDTRYGEIFVTMTDFKPKEGPAFLEAMRTKFNAYPDARIIVKQFENGPPVEAPVAIRFLGPDLAVLKSLSGQLAKVMADMEGTRDIEDPLAIDRIDIDLGLDDAKTSLLAVAPDVVRRTVRLALSGERASNFRDNEGDSYPVIVRLPMDQRQPVSALGRIYVPALDGSAVQLSQLATPTLKSVPAQIRRFKLERMVTVTTNVKPGVLASRINAQVVEKVEAMKLPQGYRYEVGGSAEASARSIGRLGGVLIFAVFGIFGVLVAEFGRFRDVAVVAGVVPLGIVGGIAALLITGNSLSFLAIIGFIALIGIEIKNSILLVDFTTQLRDRGLALRDAIEKAGEIRFLPVLLTSVTAIGGLLPLALSGAPLYAPLAWVIIGGLISSTLLSRIVTPVMYLLIARGGEDKAAKSAPALGM